MTGTKHDGGKPRFDLLPAEALEAVAKVLTFGAAKYGDRNWERGIERGRLFAAVQRHLWASWGGEADDPESGMPHLWHALTGLSMLVALDQRREKADS